MSDKRVVVQGWATWSGGGVLPRTVGARSASATAPVTIAPEGLSFEEVTQLFEAKQEMGLNAADMLPDEQPPGCGKRTVSALWPRV